MKRLEEICIFIRNGLNIKNNKSKKGIPITRIETISNGIIDINKTGYANIFDDKYIDYYLRQDDILMSHINSLKHLGKVGYCYYDMKIIHGMNLLNIRVNPNNVYPKYLYYYFKSNNFKIKLNKISKQSVNQSSFSISDLKKIKIDIIDLKKQKLIASKLDKVVEVISIRKKQIEELNNLIKSQFVEMFGDIHLNDKKWGKFVKMNEICEINPKKSEISDLRNIMVSFVPMQSVTEDGKIYTDDKRNINDVKSGFTYFRENDVLFAKITPCMENGKGAIAVNLENKIGFGSTEFHVIRPGKYVNPLWIYTLTATKEFRKQAEMSMTGSAGQKRVSSKYLENYRIGVPPITLQNEFSEIVKQIDKQKFEIEKKLKMMEKIYNIINDRRRYV